MVWLFLWSVSSDSSWEDVLPNSLLSVSPLHHLCVSNRLLRGVAWWHCWFRPDERAALNTHFCSNKPQLLHNNDTTFLERPTTFIIPTRSAPVKIPDTKQEVGLLSLLSDWLLKLTLWFIVLASLKHDCPPSTKVSIDLLNGNLDTSGAVIQFHEAELWTHDYSIILLIILQFLWHFILYFPPAVFKDNSTLSGRLK